MIAENQERPSSQEKEPLVTVRTSDGEVMTYHSRAEAIQALQDMREEQS